jgi:hypothetical protein
MANTDFNVGGGTNMKQLRQKQTDGRYHKVNQLNKGTVYFKIFCQNTGGLGKKA